MKSLISTNCTINYFFGIIIFSLLFSTTIDHIISFTILVFIVIFFIFYQPRLKINLISTIFFLIVLSINLLNFYKIEEKSNIFIPNDLNEKKYLQYINVKDYSILENQFQLNYHTNNTTCNNEESTCWENLQVNNGVSYNQNFFLRNKNYSRNILNINHKSLATIKINETNTLNLNFFKKNIFDRNNMPYFVEYKFPKIFNGSNICYKGSLILNGNLIKEISNNCLKINNQNSYLFFNFNHLEISLKKNIKSQILEYFILLVNISVMLIFYKNSKINKKEFNNKLFIILLSIIGFVYYFLRRDDFVFGYHALPGGMDGLLHESYAKDIFIYFINGNFIEFLRGNEDVYYFMPGMRYFLFLEKLFFGNNFYLIYLVMIFLPLSLYFFLKNFFVSKVSLIISILFICLNLPQLGFGSSIYYKSLLTAYPEGVLFFFLLQSLILFGYNKFFLGAIFLVFSVFLRPNFIPFILIILLANCLFLFKKKSLKNLFSLLFGISFIILIPLHNYTFEKEKFYFLTSSTNITSNKVLSLSNYSEIITNKKIPENVISHVKSFLDTGIDKNYILVINLILLLNLIFFLIIFFRKITFNDKAFIFATLLQILPSLFYINTGRFAIIIWFFILVSNLILIKYFQKKTLNIFK